MSRRKPLTIDVQISKTLSYLLRHGAEKEGLNMTKDGYVNMDELLSYRALSGFTKDDIIRVVNNNDKQRFALKYVNDDNENESFGQVASANSGSETIYVRANQGHSLEDIDVDLTEIADPKSISQCIHGTYLKFWNSIKTQGLSKMNRQHIHFSEDYPNSDKVISGMRKNCQVAIYANVDKAMKDGIKFYRSENNVILTKGDENGFLKPKYFLKVVDIKNNVNMDF